MAEGIKALMHEFAPVEQKAHSKVTVVGTGQVGMAIAYSILQQGFADEICLTDVLKDKLQGEMMDLQHGTAFTRPCIIKADTDYKVTEGSKVCVITAGCRQREGESRLSLVQRNTDIFKGIVPQLLKYSPDTILFVVSNPVDVLTYVTWKLSGLPKERVFGSGTNLDSARFRFLLSEQLQIAASSVHGWIIGEHGDSSVPVWSGVNVAGVNISSYAKDFPNEKLSWQEPIHKKVVDSAYEIIKLKGYTSWAIGLSAANIVKSIMQNRRSIFALSTNINGIHGIKDDIFLSLPAVVGSNGLTHVIKQELQPKEIEQLQKSSKQLLEIQNGIKF